MLAWARIQLSGHGATLIITGADTALRIQLEAEAATTPAAPTPRVVADESSEPGQDAGHPVTEIAVTIGGRERVSPPRQWTAPLLAPR